MKLKPCIYYLGLSCFPISIMALLNIFYSFYFDYLLNVQTYIAVLFLSLIVGFNLYNFGKKEKENINIFEQIFTILLIYFFISFFIQIPFFFAIYKVLFVTIEMRHQPFFGWIKDLSERDPTSIFNLFGLIPWDPPSFLLIGVWPCLMGVSMWMQQKLNPTPPDPVQAKIFMFFPLFLTVILAPFPAGLVIYWTINNILTMAQQYIIIKRTTVKTV